MKLHNPTKKAPKMSAGKDKIIDSKPSSSGSMLILSGVYNPANITFIFHYSLHASSRRSAKHSNVHSSSDHRGVDIGSICSTPWRSVAPLHRRWRKPLRVSKKGVGSNKATISCPKIRENHGKLWISLAFLKIFEDFHQGSHLKHPTNGIRELISLGLFVLQGKRTILKFAASGFSNSKVKKLL